MIIIITLFTVYCQTYVTYLLDLIDYLYNRLEHTLGVKALPSVRVLLMAARP